MTVNLTECSFSFCLFTLKTIVLVSYLFVPVYFIFIEICPSPAPLYSTWKRLFELLDIDIEKAVLLYQAYGVEHKQYQGIFNNPEDYEVPLIDMFLYLFDKIDEGIVSLTDDQLERVTELRSSLMKGIEQLQGENYTRIIITATVPVEGSESIELVE